MPSRDEDVSSTTRTKLLAVGSVSELPPGAMKLVPGIDRVDVMVFNHDGRFYAISNVCPHKGAPLSEGQIRAEYVECPWHKAMIRYTDGRGSWPAGRGVRSFPVRVEAGVLFIETPI